jgi:crossover junction endodeoxyribonuclease RuvC
MLILGLDPGLGTTGWGVIRAQGNRLSHVANGQIRTATSDSLAARLVALDAAIASLISEYRPDEAAVEEVFVNTNPQSTLKLGQARGVVLLSAARTSMPVGEYAARFVKKAIVGVGNASKDQIHAMVMRLLPGTSVAGADAADALAVAITHAHLRASAQWLNGGVGGR